MAELYIRRVNQTLAFVRLSLEQLELELQATPSSPLRLRAMRESCLAHLHSVFRAYLGEVAERYRIPLSHLTLSALNDALARSGQVVPEAREINTLLDKRDSWLRALFDALESIDKPETTSSTGSELASEISITSIPTHKTLNERLDDGLPLWYSSMSELVQRHRSITQEW